jgi:hypothetical protein
MWEPFIGTTVMVDFEAYLDFRFQMRLVRFIKKENIYYILTNALA